MLLFLTTHFSTRWRSESCKLTHTRKKKYLQNLKRSVQILSDDRPRKDSLLLPRRVSFTKVRIHNKGKRRTSQCIQMKILNFHLNFFFFKFFFHIPDPMTSKLIHIVMKSFKIQSEYVNHTVILCIKWISLFLFSVRFSIFTNKSWIQQPNIC